MRESAAHGKLTFVNSVPLLTWKCKEDSGGGDSRLSIPDSC
jgi:hypothetical protein